MNNIVIKPLEGILLNGITVRLGASEAEVKAALGEPESAHGSSLYFFGSELRVDFDPLGNAEFIEFLGGADGALQPTIYGVPAFGTGADELYALLAEKNGGAVNDSEHGYSYAFPNISVGIYRESIPENVSEMIAEAEREGFPMSAEDIAAERRKAAFWATVGIGIADYYSSP
ncbi:MAG: hypothetical protein NC299_13985 [Lachnospiraceae bacterium]|nr:hypothetical protein [Ruminococcus sp.]MCM1276446.1 hypothetical protein [Lachnospiraceae bacterium]